MGWKKLLRAAYAGLIGTVLAGRAEAQVEPRLVPEVVSWAVNPSFGDKSSVSRSISGAACTPGLACLAVDDEQTHAQFFTISGTRLVPEPELIHLVPKGEASEELDLEGVAYLQDARGRGYFYFVGSHAAPRKKSKKVERSRYWLFRLAVDTATGRPVSRDGGNGVDGAIEKTDALAEILRSAPMIGQFADLRDSDNGKNIEGIAVRDGRIHLGLRAPVIDTAGAPARAYIVSIDDAEAIGAIGGNRQVSALELGKGQGIRDLAAVSDGLLVLSGPSAAIDDEKRHAVFHWTPGTGALKPLGTLGGLPKGAKAETLLVLEDAPGAPYRVLVMMDGIADGGPVSYRVPR